VLELGQELGPAPLAGAQPLQEAGEGFPGRGERNDSILSLAADDSDDAHIAVNEAVRSSVGPPRCRALLPVPAKRGSAAGAIVTRA
jgi:hypothetical protein